MSAPKYAIELHLTAAELDIIIRALRISWGLIDEHAASELFTDDAKSAAGGVMFDIIAQLLEEQELLIT